MVRQADSTAEPPKPRTGHDENGEANVRAVPEEPARGKKSCMHALPTPTTAVPRQHTAAVGAARRPGFTGGIRARACMHDAWARGTTSRWQWQAGRRICTAAWQLAARASEAAHVDRPDPCPEPLTVRAAEADDANCDACDVRRRHARARSDPCIASQHLTASHSSHI